jgi:hypothetical protein
MNISGNINQFLEGRGKNKGRNPNTRYASLIIVSIISSHLEKMNP